MGNEDLSVAQKSLNVSSVNLRDTKVFVHEELDIRRFDRNLATTQGYRFNLRIKELEFTDPEQNKTWEYHYYYSTGLRIIKNDEEEEAQQEGYIPILEITCIFEAIYFSEKKLTQDQQKAFSIDNVGYHVWPYWREYVQSTCARMGLNPTLEIPVYIMQRD